MPKSSKILVGLKPSELPTLCMSPETKISPLRPGHAQGPYSLRPDLNSVLMLCTSEMEAKPLHESFLILTHIYVRALQNEGEEIPRVVVQSSVIIRATKMVEANREKPQINHPPL